MGITKNFPEEWKSTESQPGDGRSKTANNSIVLFFAALHENIAKTEEFNTKSRPFSRKNGMIDKKSTFVRKKSGAPMPTKAYLCQL